jgi:thiamine biosynthesis lipoprotein
MPEDSDPALPRPFRSGRRGPGLAAALALLALLTGPPAAGGEIVRDGRAVMGTVLEITVEHDDPVEAREALEACYARATLLEVLFTRWDDDSELVRLNRAAGGPPRKLSPALARILRDSIELAERTEGAFDPTVGPLVTLWRRAGREGRLPDPDALAAARAAVGYRGIELEDGRGRLAREGMAIDLGGVAKGWALDRLGEVLATYGIRRALLDFGGSSMLGIGSPSDAPSWRVLVSDPRGGYAGVVGLRDQSLSVSESFGESALVEGRRLGHVIDPRSGEPLDRQTGAVVVAPTGAEAEAWSKALLVLTPQRALRLLTAAPDTEAMLLEPSGARRATPGFQAAVDFVPGPTTISGTGTAEPAP